MPIALAPRARPGSGASASAGTPLWRATSMRRSKRPLGILPPPASCGAWFGCIHSSQPAALDDRRRPGRSGPSARGCRPAAARARAAGRPGRARSSSWRSAARLVQARCPPAPRRCPRRSRTRSRAARPARAAAAAAARAPAARGPRAPARAAVWARSCRRAAGHRCGIIPVEPCRHPPTAPPPPAR